MNHQIEKKKLGSSFPKRSKVHSSIETNNNNKKSIDVGGGGDRCLDLLLKELLSYLSKYNIIFKLKES